MSNLSRRYRPQNFADVTDQDPIKETLRLEVETKKIGHAYLFAGPRGVGKTTLARIFAKALNCTSPKKGEPCNACSACKEFNEGRTLDYIEMDAASNTGIDNIREAIIEHVRFAPSGHSYKIYTLDEAHMLSTAAWNALLKTIEEPPPYAKFIFVTTELHKVPTTIQSRCQRFDFKRVPQDALETRIKILAKKEGSTIDDSVVHTIAAKADGCVRDAETFLGQMFSLGETHITPDVASLVLPLSRLPIAARILASWSKRKLGPALELINELEEQGIPLIELFNDLLEAVRDLLLAADSEIWRKRLTDGDAGERAVANNIGVFSPEELSRIALVLMARRKDAKQGSDGRFCLELAGTAVVLGLLNGNPPTPGQSDPISTPSAEPAKQPTEPAAKKNPPVSAMTLGAIQSKWPAFLRALDAKSTSLTFIMKLVHPVTIEGNELTLEFQYPFHRDKALQNGKAKHIIREALIETFGIPHLIVKGIIGNEQADAKERREQNTASSIIKVFGGQLIDDANATP